MVCPVDSQQTQCPFEKANRKGICSACGFDPAVHVPDSTSREAYLAHCRGRLRTWTPPQADVSPAMQEELTRLKAENQALARKLAVTQEEATHAVARVQAELDSMRAQVAATPQPAELPALPPLQAPTPTAGFWSQLMRGDSKLARAYWFYGVMAIPFLTGLFNPWYWVLISTVIIYHSYCVMEMWRAAGFYTGKKPWTVVARVIVVLAAFLLAYMCAVVTDRLLDLLHRD